MGNKITVVEAGASRAITDGTGGASLPVLVKQASPATTKRFLEFFAVTLRNPHTRAAYVQAVGTFLAWVEPKAASLEDVAPVHVAAYVEELGRVRAPRTVKQHLAAIRGMFGWLISGGTLPHNPAADVRGPSATSTGGQTPVLFEDDARDLLEWIDTSHVVGLRDRALIGVMLYSFARVSAAVKMRVRDYEVMGRRASLVLHEKGGKFHRVPAHHKLADFLDSYIAAAGIEGDRDGPLFRSARGRSKELTTKALDRRSALYMVKRRATDAGMPAEAVCSHTFRATGVTNFMANGGTLEAAASIAAHASTRTTQLYNRNEERIAQGEIERIRI